MTMNDVTKLSTSKDILAYLAEQFPACFVLTGATQPLKIGIFDDLAARLADDPKVSKTRLRSAVRHYTNSWRYLRCIKVGSERLDLDGKAAGLVEASHADHAQQQLAEAKAQLADKKAANTSQADPAAQPDKNAKAHRSKRAQPARSNPSGAAKARTSVATPQPAAPKPSLKPAAAADLKVGQLVQVKVANNTVSGQITEIDRNDLQVQLHNGLTVKVQYDAVYLAKQES
jgi:ProP effector